MMMFMKTHKFWIVGILLLFGIYFITLFPSFNLALTGDDYLGLWRYQFYHNGWGGETLSNWSYFFTDYGPMDMLTAVIHHYFGFNHQVYYIFSFALRFLAALSFLWPVYTLTKNKWASIGAAAFFAVTTTGLEATDWSFNMPSYIAIALANTFLGCFILARTKNHLLIWIASAALFVLAIISQPVRTMFLPILIVGLEIYWLITNFNLKNVGLGLLRISLYIFLLMTILKYTNYGGAVSLRGSKALSQNFQQVIQLINDKNYKILVSPVSQIGSIILPNDFMYQRIEVWGLPRTFRRVVGPTFVLFGLALVIFKTRQRQLVAALILAAGWTAFIWQTFMPPSNSALQPFELLTYLLGGYILIGLGLLWLNAKTQPSLRLGLVLSILMLVSGFILFWIRYPGQLYEITGRYLIVSGAGLAWLMAMLLAVKTKFRSKIILILSFGFMFSLHAKVSYKYLYHLSEVRGIELTTRIRNSVKPPKNFGKPNIPLVFYFEGDNPEVIYHSFIFGWPVISHYQFNISGPWYNVAPTENWQEVVSAYQDGESLKRFMPGPYGPVELENIYAYKLENKTLYDITDEKRELLKRIKYAESK
ncbi:MAG: hypothetical protein UX99_C0001G0010 [Candidatus Amesbacteria bacterium GW2011_GWB1_47_26]|nr:MAG: hypothetical protein UX99_C0001G0010 [Candidatus Amesbacteria bacterium GW2011_GWB1_47_26]